MRLVYTHISGHRFISNKSYQSWTYIRNLLFVLDKLIVNLKHDISKKNNTLFSIYNQTDTFFKVGKSILFPSIIVC